MATQVDLSHFGGPFRLARRNRGKISRADLAKLLNIPECDLVRFERGDAPLTPETLELIMGAGIIMIQMAMADKPAPPPPQETHEIKIYGMGFCDRN